MFENIRQACQSVLSHKMRTFLTMLGIIIGIASIISIVSTIKGTNEQMKKNIIGSGNNTVEVELSEKGYPYEAEYSGIPAGVPVFEEDILPEIRDLAHVEDAALYNARDVMEGVYYQNIGLTSGRIYGVRSDYFSVCGYRLVSGRLFVEEDYEKFHKVAIVETETARILFQGKNPIGEILEIEGEPFTVIGLVEPAGESELVIQSPEDYYNYMAESACKVFISQAAWSIPYLYDEPANLVVRASTTDYMNAAGKVAANHLNTYLTDAGKEMRYKASNTLDRAQEMQELSKTTNQQLLWIASISLLVGGIGVMNIMLVSVTERTSEIGLKKAIGAKNDTIMLQFLTESVVITSLGGVIGVIAGIILAEIISVMTGTPVAISIPAILIAVVFSMVIGIVFGLIPSVKAARMNPIEALRYE
ncbi:MAG: ABC transporter permease [Lachnospiraceae bacterium]|nr:ABC transporter permease [Lachnospiraceae bacterium]